MNALIEVVGASVTAILLAGMMIFSFCLGMALGNTGISLSTLLP